MNNILSFLNSHGSVRSFTDKEISSENESLIISTAERSATSSNLHAYSIIGLRDIQKKTNLAELCGGQEHIEDCSLFLVFCADMFRLKKLRESEGYEFYGDSMESLILATVDASLAACRALMAAQALDMGGVMVGGIRNHPDQVCELLELPELVYPVMGMSLGYPESPPKLKPRLPLGGIYFTEHYDKSRLNDAVAEYDMTISNLGYLNGREVDPDKYPNNSDEYSWSEHSARRMANSNPGTARLHMREFLQQRGFMKR